MTALHGWKTSWRGVILHVALLLESNAWLATYSTRCQNRAIACFNRDCKSQSRICTQSVGSWSILGEKSTSIDQVSWVTNEHVSSSGTAPGTPLEWYNDLIDRRLEEADEFPIEPQESLEDGENVPLIGFLDLLHMAFAAATSDTMRAKRRDFVSTVQNAGGYCIVKLEDPELSVVDGMWDGIDEIFARPRRKDTAVTGAAQLELRHQTLTREDRTELHQNSGYKFVQISLVDNSIPYLADSVGQQSAEQAGRVYQLFSLLAKAFASVSYAGSCTESEHVANKGDPKQASDLLTKMLDDPGKPFSGTFHRLAKYVPVPEEEDWSESLRSHCDWTLSTPIPVSATAGLEIFNPTSHTWIRPEQTAKALWEHEKGEHRATDDNRWHSRYVIVMTGKWLELISKGEILSCIHRVVSIRGENSRLSAPFFMRPRPQVFSDAEAVQFKNGTSGNIESMRAIGEYLLHKYGTDSEYIER
jgi:hypothetical protein